MPEGVAAYPRWKGPLSTGPAFPVILAEELQRFRRSTWGLMALLLPLALAVFWVGSLNTLAGARSVAAVHTMDNFLLFLNSSSVGLPLLRLLSVIGAAVIAGPALLDDARRGALELYLSRGIAQRDYLLGKVLAVVGVAAAIVVLPGLLYWATSYVMFDEQPAGWVWVPLGVLVDGVLWGLMIGGLGLGLSAVSKSSRAAALLLAGGIFIADTIVANLLEAITRDGRVQVMSPISAMAQQSEWLFGTPGRFGFPAWWGLVLIALLIAVGWALVALKRPRLAGG